LKLRPNNVAERAMVSRAAFYRYHHDKYELVESMFRGIMASVVREVDPLRQAEISRVKAQAPRRPGVRCSC